jgi:hypothetical protein
MTTLLPARNTDPATSHEAAEHVIASGKRAAQQRMTAVAVESYPGLTSLELSRKAKIDRYVLARRLSEVEKDGLIKRGVARTCTVSGRSAVTWWRPDHIDQPELFK